MRQPFPCSERCSWIRCIVALAFLILASGDYCTTQAQSISPSAAVPAGGEGAGTDFSLSWTLGQPASAMFVGGSELVTAGVQQPEGVRSELAVRVWLDGPYSPSQSLMHDSLRTRGLLPTIEPYSSLGYSPVGFHGGSVVAPGTFSASGSNAIVDWIFVELRSSFDPATVLASRSALLQRDGDVVDLDGLSPVSITALPGIYHLAVRHRNHLPVMTLLPIVIGPGPNLIDLTSSGIALHVPTARRDLNGVLLLWSGDARGNEDVKYTGASNDRDVLLLAIGGLIPTNTVTAYSRSDLNMDGTVKYTGSQNDRDIILRSIGGAVLTTVRSQPLP